MGCNALPICTTIIRKLKNMVLYISASSSRNIANKSQKQAMTSNFAQEKNIIDVDAKEIRFNDVFLMNGSRKRCFDAMRPCRGPGSVISI